MTGTEVRQGIDRLPAAYLAARAGTEPPSESRNCHMPYPGQESEFLLLSVREDELTRSYRAKEGAAVVPSLGSGSDAYFRPIVSCGISAESLPAVTLQSGRSEPGRP